MSWMDLGGVTGIGTRRRRGRLQESGNSRLLIPFNRRTRFGMTHFRFSCASGGAVTPRGRSLNQAEDGFWRRLFADFFDDVFGLLGFAVASVFVSHGSSLPQVGTCS